MKKHTLYFFCTLVVFLFLLANCYVTYQDVRENRTDIIGTNIIGIVGEASEEPYIEIQYSIADEENPCLNKTTNIMVSPPYVFQNDKVYFTYEYVEFSDSSASTPLYYSKYLQHDYKEGGAEYLRIINHSPGKSVEFFIAGTETGELITKGYPDTKVIPSVHYRKAPLYFLLFPEYKYTENVIALDGKIYHYFEGDRCGDITLSEAWTVEEVAALYRAEYARSNEVRMTVGDLNYRMIDLVEGKIAGREEYKGGVFYGVIGPGEQLQGNEQLWLLANTSGMFSELLESEYLR
jgi:hypothetical protein